MRYWRGYVSRLTALCPGLPRWAGTRKVKPIWILLKQETVSGSGISWAICKSAPRPRQITVPAPNSVFTGRICHPTNSIKALKAMCLDQYVYYLHTVQSVTLPSQNPIISRLTKTQDRFTFLVPSYVGCLVVMWTHTHSRSATLCLGLPGEASTRRNIHQLMPMRKKKDLHRQGPLCWSSSPLQEGC